jgi:hypothetical protein
MTIYVIKAMRDGVACRVCFSVPPDIYELKNLSKTENETATLTCLSHGDPAPKMTFQKVGNRHAYNATNVSTMIDQASRRQPPANKVIWSGQQRSAGTLDI